MDDATMQIQLVSVPYRYDELREGLGLGPDALIAAGIVGRLSDAGHEVLAPVEAHLDASDRDDDRTAVNIGKLGAKTAELVAAARKAGHASVVLAGDDTAAVGVVAGLQAADGPGSRIGIVWLDAHGDFNTPETSYSGILAGMPLAIIAGLAGPLWRAAAGLAAPIPTDRILLAGIRDLDEQEETLLKSTGVRVVRAKELDRAEPFDEVIERLARVVDVILLHIDLDVLDPHLVPSASTPSAEGLEIEGASAALRAVLTTGKVACLCVTSLNPGGGTRGQRSIASALATIGGAAPAWTTVPGPQ